MSHGPRRGARAKPSFGAEFDLKTINQVAESKGKPVLESVGYTAEY